MRWSSIITLLCSAAALVLSFLLIFAGGSRSFLQNTSVLTLNTSRLGYNLIDGSNNALVNDAADEIASLLNISDFYTVHVMNYCQGEYESGNEMNTTRCSPRSAMFHFNITQIVDDALPSQIQLSDIDWPSSIDDAQNAIRMASIATVVLYILAIVFTALAVLFAIFGFFTSGRLSACCNLLIDLLAFICIGGASAVATVVMVKVVAALNQYGNQISVSATRGNKFLAMTWAATAVMLIALLVSFVQLCVGRRDHSRRHAAQMKEQRAVSE